MKTRLPKKSQIKHYLKQLKQAQRVCSGYCIVTVHLVWTFSQCLHKHSPSTSTAALQSQNDFPAKMTNGNFGMRCSLCRSLLLFCLGCYNTTGWCATKVHIWVKCACPALHWLPLSSVGLNGWHLAVKENLASLNDGAFQRVFSLMLFPEIVSSCMDAEMTWCDPSWYSRGELNRFDIYVSVNILHMLLAIHIIVLCGLSFKGFLCLNLQYRLHWRQTVWV